MAKVTAFEAKTRFGELLERVAKGEEVVITRHDKPVARLVPEGAQRLDEVSEAYKGSATCSRESASGRKPSSPLARCDPPSRKAACDARLRRRCLRRRRLGASRAGNHTDSGNAGRPCRRCDARSTRALAARGGERTDGSCAAPKAQRGRAAVGSRVAPRATGADRL